jgi:hypothetical protein
MSANITEDQSKSTVGEDFGFLEALLMEALAGDLEPRSDDEYLEILQRTRRALELTEKSQTLAARFGRFAQRALYKRVRAVIKTHALLLDVAPRKH